jgi:hypothetical protein
MSGDKEGQAQEARIDRSFGNQFEFGAFLRLVNDAIETIILIYWRRTLRVEKMSLIFRDTSARKRSC